MECLIKREAINLPYIMMCQMRETIRKAKTCLPYGMVFTLLFQVANIDLTEEDGKALHHTDTYSSKSLIRMGYHFSDGHWKKKVLGQRAIESSSDDEDEEMNEQLPNIEFVPAAAEVSVLEAKVQEQNERQTQAPPVVTPAPTLTKASTFEPLVSQKNFEQQMRQLSQSITSSMGSMFDKLNQSVESRFQRISEEINQLKAGMDTYDLTRPTQKDDQGPSTSSILNISTNIIQTLHQGIEV